MHSTEAINRALLAKQAPLLPDLPSLISLSHFPPRVYEFRFISKEHKLTVDTSPKALCLWRLPRGIYSARTTLHIPTGNMNVTRASPK